MRGKASGALFERTRQPHRRGSSPPPAAVREGGLERARTQSANARASVWFLSLFLFGAAEPWRPSATGQDPLGWFCRERLVGRHRRGVTAIRRCSTRAANRILALAGSAGTEHPHTSRTRSNRPRAVSASR